MSGQGRVVARGTIRVDASKAVEQLRSHLLIDLHSYTHEALRFAVSGGATRVDARFDRETVALQWDGQPIAPEALRGLLGSLLTHGADHDSRRSRLLALAVNAALGLGPDYVEIHANSPERCVRMRWTPHTVGEGQLPDPEVVVAPEGLCCPGMRLEVRKGFRWTTLLSAGTSSLPKELETLRGTTALLGDRLTLHGRAFPRYARANALVRMPFDLPGANAAFVELIDSGADSPVLEVHEHGVLLVASRWRPNSPFPDDPYAGFHLPVRVLVDSDELETNASRSALRNNAVLLRELPVAATAAFLSALQTLCARVTGTAGGHPAAQIIGDNTVELENTLGAIVCVFAGARRDRRDEDWSAIDPFLRLPLLRDALGRPCSVWAHAAAMPEKVLVWRGQEPVEPGLEPWVRDVLWLRNTAVERLLSGAQIVDAAAVVERARVALERRQRFLSLPRASGLLESRDDQLVRATIDIRDGAWQGLRGEVALVAPGRRVSSMSVRVLVEGRVLQTMTIPTAVAPLLMEAAIEWEGRLQARFDYDGVVDNAELRGALWVAIMQGVRLADGLATGLGAMDGAKAEPLRELLRAAIGALVGCGTRLQLDNRVVEPALSTFASLWNARVWPVASGGHVSTAFLSNFVASCHALCIAPPGSRGTAPDGRPVVTCDRQQLAWLSNAFGAATVAVPYGHTLVLDSVSAQQRVALRRSRVDEAIDKAREDAPHPTDRVAMRVAEGTVVATIALSARSRTLYLHCGALVGESSGGPFLAPVLIAIDDDSCVPTPQWNAILRAGANPDFADHLQWRFADCIVARLEGAPPADDTLEGMPSRIEDASPTLIAWLLRVAATIQELRSDTAQQLLGRIRALPMLRVLDAQGNPCAASLEQVLAWHASLECIPALASPPGFPTLEWRPVLMPEEPAREALRQALHGRLQEASRELTARKREADNERAWASVIQTECQDPHAVRDAVDPDLPVAFVALAAAAGCPAGTAAAGVAESGPTKVRVLCRTRVVTDVVLDDWREPLTLTVDLVDRAHLNTSGQLTVEGNSFVLRAAARARLKLSIQLVVRAKGEGNAAKLFDDPRVLSILAAAVRNPAAEDADLTFLLHNELRDPGLLWRTVRGSDQPIEQLRVGEPGLYFGRTLYAVWKTSPEAASELDSPIAYAPPGPHGELILDLLQCLAGTLRDVTELLAMLQLRRAEGAQPGSRIVTPPAHPALRCRLFDLGVSCAQGELEIMEGAGCDVNLIGWEGRPAPVEAKLPIPIRVTAQVDALLTEDKKREVLADLTRAAARFLRSLGDRLDELPPFVRGHLRRLVCVGLARSKKQPEQDLRFPVFGDIRGSWHSAEELLAQPAWMAWQYTTDPPPYPDQGSPVLQLTQEEATSLGKSLKLNNVTMVLRKAREAHARRTAVPLDRVELDASLRSACLKVFRIDHDGITGEVGLLSERCPEKRGIRVHVQHRLLCTIADGPGWPLCAAVNHDGLTPNNDFDGLRNTRERTDLNARVREFASSQAREWFCSSHRELTARFVDLVDAAQGSPIYVLGLLWLPRCWPRIPHVAVASTLRNGALRRSLLLGQASPLIEPLIPVCGQLHVCHAPDAREKLTDRGLEGIESSVLARVALDQTLSMWAEVESKLDVAEAEAYRWNLALLGVPTEGLVARCVDESTVEAKDLMARLLDNQTIRIAAQASPKALALPWPVLFDDGGAGVRVLRARARKALEPIDSKSAIQPQEPIFDESIDEGSWLGRVLDAIYSAVVPEPPAGEFDPSLLDALRLGLQGMRLTGDPVKRLIAVGRGRPVRYRKRDGTLYINTAHPSVIPCLRRSRESALAWLLCAAVTEINRELAGVTDAEERRALEDILQSLPAAPLSKSEG